MAAAKSEKEARLNSNIQTFFAGLLVSSYSMAIRDSKVSHDFC